MHDKNDKYHKTSLVELTSAVDTSSLSSFVDFPFESRKHFGYYPFIKRGRKKRKVQIMKPLKL